MNHEELVSLYLDRHWPRLGRLNRWANRSKVPILFAAGFVLAFVLITWPLFPHALAFWWGMIWGMF